MEEIILLVLIALSLFITYALYKILDKQGLYYSLIMLDLLAYILTFKITTVLKMNINIGIVPLISSFTCLYLILIKYGNKNIKNIFKITFLSNVVFGLLLTTTNYFFPSLTDTISKSIEETFITNYKLLILFPIVVFSGQYVINKIYGYVTDVQNNIFLATMLSYIISAITYIIIFYIIGYINILTIRDSLYLGVTTYITGIIVTIINIAFIYSLNRKKAKKW